MTNFHFFANTTEENWKKSVCGRKRNRERERGREREGERERERERGREREGESLFPRIKRK
jgi:hypothetical protein